MLKAQDNSMDSQMPGGTSPRWQVLRRAFGLEIELALRWLTSITRSSISAI
jgi:hypothetical protein